MDDLGAVVLRVRPRGGGQFVALWLKVLTFQKKKEREESNTLLTHYCHRLVWLHLVSEASLQHLDGFELQLEYNQRDQVPGAQQLCLPYRAGEAIQHVPEVTSKRLSPPQHRGGDVALRSLPASVADQAQKRHLQALDGELIRDGQTPEEVRFHLDGQLGVLVRVEHHAHHTADGEPSQAVLLSKHLRHCE